MTVTITEGSEPIPGYRLIKLLGQGGVGQVWKAEAPGGVHVTFKFVRTDTGHADPELRAIKAIRNNLCADLLDIRYFAELTRRVLAILAMAGGLVLPQLLHAQDSAKPPALLIAPFGQATAKKSQQQ